MQRGCCPGWRRGRLKLFHKYIISIYYINYHYFILIEYIILIVIIFIAARLLPWMAPGSSILFVGSTLSDKAVAGNK